MKTNLKPISNSSKKAFFFVNRPIMNMLNFVYEINLVDLQSFKKDDKLRELCKTVFTGFPIVQIN